MLKASQDLSGLSYRRNRNYDAQATRFTQTDPIGLNGGHNLYGYAAGDPVNFADPFGLNPCAWVLVMGSAGTPVLGIADAAACQALIAAGTASAAGLVLAAKAMRDAGNWARAHADDIWDHMGKVCKDGMDPGSWPDDQHHIGELESKCRQLDDRLDDMNKNDRVFFRRLSDMAKDVINWFRGR